MERVLKIAVIGFGTRVSWMVKLMREFDPAVKLVAVADPNAQGVTKCAHEIGIEEPVRIFGNADELLENAADFDGVMIGTRCSLHTTMALKVAPTKLPLFLEKPVALNLAEWEQLRSAYAGRENSVVVSFPLRLSPHVQKCIEIINSGRVGTINQIQAVNNVPYGGVYYGQWYRDYNETGGLWLQKATHDFDYINQLMMANPTLVMAMHSRKIYGGSMPADLRCSQCDLTETCKESPRNLTARGDDGGMMNTDHPTAEMDHACAFSSSIKNQDAGSAIILYDNGAHANYVQNFVPRRSAGKRGATIIGYNATLSFDWQSGGVRVIDHHRDNVEDFAVSAQGQHGGGDHELAKNFIDLLRGRDVSKSNLSDGLLSAAMCLAARESATKKTAQAVRGAVHHHSNCDIEPV